MAQDAPDAGGAGGNEVAVEHHEGKPAIAFQRIVVSEGDGLAFFVLGEPVVAWHPSVMFIDFAIALFPVVELAGAQADPTEKAAASDLGLIGPGADEINEVVAGIVGDPAALYISPRFFLTGYVLP